MAGSDAGIDPPRIERRTLWAVALDVAVVVSVVVSARVAVENEDSDNATSASIFFAGFVAPIATLTALVIAVRSALRAGRTTAKSRRGSQPS